MQEPGKSRTTIPIQMLRMTVMRLKRFPIILVPALLFACSLFAQVPGVPPVPPDVREPAPASDSTFIFTPARPLIDSTALQTILSSAFGMNILFSNSGYGLGFFYEKKFSPTFSGFIDLGFSGARKGDELEVYNRDPSSVHYLTFFVPNKVNRVWHMPLMAGVKKEVFSQALFSNFRPYVNAGVGGTLIMTTPYDREFFSAFGDAEFHVAPGGFIGIGAEVSDKSPGIGLNARYYYLPINPGIESLRGEPITNFGGLFLTLNVPF